MGRKPEGFFRIIPKSGKEYVIKVRSKRYGEKVKQEFLFHVGSVEELRKLVCVKWNKTKN